MIIDNNVSKAKQDQLLCILSCVQKCGLMRAAIAPQNIALSGLYQYKIWKF